MGWAGVAANLVRARFPTQSWEPPSGRSVSDYAPGPRGDRHAERVGVAGEPAGWLLDRASNYLQERGQYRQPNP